MDTTEIKTKELLKKVKKLELRTKFLVDGLLQGAYHSIFHGRGIEFSEVREYQVGDDIRTIDWNVTARMGYPFVKEFIEERDLLVHIVFDMSSSSEFGYSQEKKMAYIELATSLMFAALRNNDRIGLCIFSNGVKRYIKPRKGKKHILRLIRELLIFKPDDKTTDLNKTLLFLLNLLKQRNIIFIISDFFCSEFEQPLKILKQRHDIILIKYLDKRENEIPDIGYVELEDAETGEQILVNTSNPVFRENFSRFILDYHNRFREKMKRIGVDLIEIRTDIPYELTLRKFFKMRERRCHR